MAKGAKIDTSDLELTDKQKEKLTPLVDKVMERMTIKASPEACLAISLICIYGVNFFTAKMLAKKETKK